MPAQVMEGTTEEITTWLQKAYSGQNLRITIEPHEEDLAAGIPDPPFTVRSEAHLIELLQQGLDSPVQEVTDETWEQKRQEVRCRHATQQP